MAAMHAYDELDDRSGSRAMAQAVLKFNPKNVDALLTLAQLTLEDSSGFRTRRQNGAWPGTMLTKGLPS